MELAVSVARRMPAGVKRFAHRFRFIDRLSRIAFYKAVGNHDHVIQAGPMAGLKLAPSQHISHAHISGTYELETLQAVDQLVQPGFVCYDLGASIGYFSLLMARKAAAVYAFEPAPHAAAELCKHVVRNGLTNILLVPVPLSDTEREVVFVLTDVAYGSAINPSEKKWPAVTMRTTTVDRFAAAHAPPDFLKIDVEGEEANVLTGAVATLDKNRPVVCCECHSVEQLERVEGLLQRFGYRFFDLNGGPFRPPAKVTPGEVHLIGIPQNRSLPPPFGPKAEASCAAVSL